MTKEELLKQLSQLLEETWKAHHQAYIETDGFDPEWPLWYAEYLMDKLPPILGREFTKSDLVFDLVTLSREQPQAAPDAHWPDYYAKYFVEQYDQ